MMLKQRFDNVEMLAQGIDSWQAVIADDNIYSLDLIVV